jgi:type IV pilus assembly protein PilA
MYLHPTSRPDRCVFSYECGRGKAMDTKKGNRIRIRSPEGFTLIELMIVVAIIGVLAAIAIPAYRDYVNRVKMSEVVTAFDAIAQGATEYHAAMGFFPDESYGTKNLADFSEEYATISLNNIDANLSFNIVANFKSNLNLKTLIPGPAGDYGHLVMQITYDNVKGYSKDWAIAASDIDAIYMPKK